VRRENTCYVTVQYGTSCPQSAVESVCACSAGVSAPETGGATRTSYGWGGSRNPLSSPSPAAAASGENPGRPPGRAGGGARADTRADSVTTF
jgi:hypothetical protein